MSEIKLDLGLLVDATESTLPAWLKITKTYSDLSAAALTNDIELFSLPAGGVIHGVKIKHAEAFNVSGYKIGVGIAGSLTKYASKFDVNQAVVDGAYQMSQCFFSESHANVTSVRLSAEASNNLSTATTGVVEVWLLLSFAS